MAHSTQSDAEAQEKVSLSKAATFLLDECRMVLPGIQALFGFQLIAVFSDGFSEKLGPGEQKLHLLAIVLIAIAIALIMSPASFHRHAGLKDITESLIMISTRLLLWSMFPLSLGICLDFYLIAKIILNSPWVAAFAGLMFLFFMLLWFILPRIAQRRKEGD